MMSCIEGGLRRFMVNFFIAAAAIFLRMKISLSTNGDGSISTYGDGSISPYEDDSLSLYGDIAVIYCTKGGLRRFMALCKHCYCCPRQPFTVRR